MKKLKRIPYMPPKTLQIRNSTAEFLIFTKQAGENGIEVRVQDGTIVTVNLSSENVPRKQLIPVVG